MAQNKEQLSKLLLFIKRLIDEPGNEDFVKGLRKLLDVPIHDSSGNKQLTDIEKYLGLDYHLDSATPDIDYSFIRDENVRTRLISDYREMLRYRYGVRSHKIDFFEFCRYAMLQVEQLLNYFYKNCFDTIDEIRDYINEHVTNLKVESLDSLKSISLAIKLYALYCEKGDGRIKTVLDYAREVRNEQSHRMQNEDADFIKEYRTKLINRGFPLTKDGEIYWNGIKDNEALVSKYEGLNKAELKAYRYQLWRYREPFEEVLNSLHQTAIRVKSLTASK